MDKVEVCHIRDYEMPALEPTNPENDYGAYKGSAVNHHYIIENIVDVLQGRASPAVDAEEGAAVVDMIQRIYSRTPDTPLPKKKED
jgi:hypothetical protein